MRKVKFDMTWGRMNYYHKVKYMVDEIENELNTSNVELILRYYLLGKIDGLSEGQNISHKKVIDTIIALRKEINELKMDYELYKYEIEYNKGFYNGLEKILDINRDYFNNHMPLLFLTYFEDNLLLTKYKVAMLLTNLKEYNDEENFKEAYFFSNNVDDVIKIIEKNMNKKIELSLSVVAYDKNSCILDKLKKISQIEPENIFIIFDNETINAKKMIDKILNYHIIS